MKPTSAGMFIHQAAREKIASDIGHEVGVSVPPVLLLRRATGDGCRPSETGCLSLVCYTNQFEIGDVFDPNREDGGAVGVQAQLFRSLLGSSGFVALDALLQNTDRVNARNTLVGFDAKDGAFVGGLLFIDYSHAMAWNAANLANFQRVNIPPVLKGLLDRDGAVEAAGRISRLSDELITDIVNRIPDDFLDLAARELLRNGLIARRQTISANFSVWYPG